MDNYTFQCVKGMISEVAALRWLQKNIPHYDWSITDKFSSDDMEGIDIIGICWTGNVRNIQVKSSNHAWLKEEYKAEVLIVPQGENEEPYFI